MKNIMLSFFLWMFFLGCNSNEGDEIYLFNGISFELIEGEKVIKLDKDRKEIFHSYINNKSVQIPLFRFIESKDYSIFVGLPFNTSIKELSNLSIAPTFNQTFFEGDSTSYFFKKYINDKEHVSIYTRNFSNNLVYVLTVTNSAIKSDSLLHKNALSNRFQQ